jgi:hypothetical protein
LDTQVVALRHETERPGLTRWTVLIGASVFAFTMSQPTVLRLPFQNLLKAQMHVSREAIVTFFAASAIAYYFKPLAGILSDSMLLFGTRRRHYLLLSALAAAVLHLLVGVVPHTYSAILWSIIAVNVMLFMVSTVTGGLMVKVGRRYAATGRLSSVFFLVQNACVLIVGSLGILGCKGLRTDDGCRSRCGVLSSALCLADSPRAARGGNEYQSVD